MNAPDSGANVACAADAGTCHDQPDDGRSRQLAEEQAALRRVATLVAGGARPDAVFAAVADELGHLIGAEVSFVLRVELTSGHRPGTPGEYGPPEGICVVAASYGATQQDIPVGYQFQLTPGMATSIALQLGRPAHVGVEQLARGPFAALTRTLSLRSAVATPIVVEARYWGVTIAATGQEHFPPGTEARMADFTELAATAIANAEAEEQLHKLADTQSALRRLAMLVARGEPPEAVFAAATRESRRHFGGDTARMIRYELDGTATLVANEGTTGPHVRVGERWEGYPPTGLTAAVRHTGKAARVDDYGEVPGGEAYLEEGLKSAVAVPIHVNGRLWGTIVAGTGDGPLPPDIEQRMAEFTDLVATAVANAQNRDSLEASRDELARLLEEQAALRRIATLVARGIPPREIFRAVAEEIRRLLGAAGVGIARFEPDGGSAVVVAGGGDIPVDQPDGTRVRLPEYLAPAAVWRTGHSARVGEDMWRDKPDPIARRLRELGIQCMVASPIVVEGHLWGVVNALWREGAFAPDTADRMVDFTELVATAIGNAESRAEVAASRARIVAAADEARRRIERDLHDGTQQRLVSLGLELRLAQSMVPAELPELDMRIRRTADELHGVVEDLREIARGIHPAILSDGGLAPALRTLARRAAIAVELDVAAITRLPEPIEVAAYYVVSEALTNATKHAHASVVCVDVEKRDDSLCLSIRDDGIGGADPTHGSGLIGLRDRAEALGGSLEVSSPPGEGTLLRVQLPLWLE